MIWIYFNVRQNKQHYHKEVPYHEKSPQKTKHWLNLAKIFSSQQFHSQLHTGLPRKGFFSLSLGLLKKVQKKIKMLTRYRTFPLSFSTTSLAAPVHWKSHSIQPSFFFSAYASNTTPFQRLCHMCFFHTFEYVIYLVWS